MFKKSIVLHLFIILLFIAGLLFLFFNSLNWLTNHGQEIVVPKITGKNLKAAIRDLEAKNFSIQVDSTYKPYLDPLMVLQQEPAAGISVKPGRTIFILVNRASPPKISMPDLVNKSFRNAILILKSYRLVMGDTLYRPDIAAGAVLEQRINGVKIAPGAMIPYGSRIDLVIGEGLADYEVDVPNLIGKPWVEARNILESAGLFWTTLWEGNITDSTQAIVYKQYPEALNDLDFQESIRGGDMLDIHIMQNPSAELLHKNAPGSLKYMDIESDSAKEIQSRINQNPSLKKKNNTETFINPDAEVQPEQPHSGTPIPKREVGTRKEQAEKKPGANKTAPKKEDKPVETKSDQNYSNEYE